jgi:hypothetical protein
MHGLRFAARFVRLHPSIYREIAHRFALWRIGLDRSSGPREGAQPVESRPIRHQEAST